MCIYNNLNCMYTVFLDNLVYDFYQSIYQFNNISLQIPKASLRNEIEASKYPIFAYKQDIMNAINMSRIVYIMSETGIGKTTQVFNFVKIGLLVLIKFN